MFGTEPNSFYMSKDNCDDMLTLLLITKAEKTNEQTTATTKTYLHQRAQKIMCKQTKNNCKKHFCMHSMH